MNKIVDDIAIKQSITIEDLKFLLEDAPEETVAYLKTRARKITDEVYGRDIYIRGLIEFTNYCKNDCYYCGIRKSNSSCDRYRLSTSEIMDCCRQGYELGFRTFVLQGGEDGFFSDDKICDIVSSIRRDFSDCAITLSIGEKTKDSYKRYFEAGANRYLLRHETANDEHYKMLHPAKLSLDNRKRCLFDLRDIGYQVGCGFMVGSPGQTIETIYDDLCFIKELQPHMVGIGPFIPHCDTVFAQEKAGTLEETIRLLAIIRLIHPRVLLPATTALGTIAPDGREKGILSGANVVMPNLSPVSVRKKYKLYDNKICTGDEAAECRVCLEKRINGIGYTIAVDKGDSKCMM